MEAAGLETWLGSRTVIADLWWNLASLLCLWDSSSFDFRRLDCESKMRKASIYSVCSPRLAALYCLFLFPYRRSLRSLIQSSP